MFCVLSFDQHERKQYGIDSDGTRRYERGDIELFTTVAEAKAVAEKFGGAVVQEETIYGPHEVSDIDDDLL